MNKDSFMKFFNLVKMYCQKLKNCIGSQSKELHFEVGQVRPIEINVPLSSLKRTFELVKLAPLKTNFTKTNAFQIKNWSSSKEEELSVIEQYLTLKNLNTQKPVNRKKIQGNNTLAKLTKVAGKAYGRAEEKPTPQTAGQHFL
jgi:hypothetical protein